MPFWPLVVLNDNYIKREHQITKALNGMPSLPLNESCSMREAVRWSSPTKKGRGRERERWKRHHEVVGDEDPVQGTFVLEV